MRKILLDKNRGKKTVNNTKTVPVELNRDVSLFHDELLTDTVDTMQIYNDEKDKSTKHRFIFTLYPLCSNSLFNNITEVVYNEGASDAKILTNSSANGITSTGSAISKEPITRIQAIRNTEYSLDIYKLTYHCGSDIFNNHLLRNKENVSVQKRGNNNKKTCDVFGPTGTTKVSTISDAFNTLGDYSRTYAGTDIKTYFPNADKNYTYDGNGYEGVLPLYMYDTIYPFIEAYQNGLVRKDGWMGFNNPTTLHIPIKDDYFINKCINNKEGCEFITMAPEKDLFYFTPKVNPHRKRVEYNWDYFLTYPAGSEYNDGQILSGRGQGLPLLPFKIYGGNDKMFMEQYGTNGLKTALFRSPVKHNLSIGDNINLMFNNDETVRCRVVKLGSEDGSQIDYYFSVQKDDFEDYISDTSVPKRFVKISGGFECEYYFRKFKKFEGDYKTSLTRLAFAGTVYGDEVSQIVFTDDIDINGYKDNRGRPLTEVYLTIVKANRGYKEWYTDNNASSENVEYSHVFGKVTSGLDLPFNNKELPVIRRQHNISYTGSDIDIPESSSKLEDDITNELDEFFGDLVEFNPVTASETVLEVIKHRFNTAQRECDNNEYNTLYYDELYGDNYDSDRYGTNKVSGSTRIRQFKLNEGYANLAPEGYVYIPHHKIQIGEFDNIVRQLSDIIIEYDGTVSGIGKTLRFKTVKNYGLLQYDTVAIASKIDGRIYQYSVQSYKKYGDFFICDANLLGEDVPESYNQDDYWFFKHNLEIPSYAYMLPDGTGRHIWRDIMKPSTVSFLSDLYNVPFTNGAFYHHTNVTFPVQRQDPFRTFGMQIKKDGKLLENNFEIPATKLDISVEDYMFETNNTSCF